MAVFPDSGLPRPTLEDKAGRSLFRTVLNVLRRGRWGW